ncbi:MAG TPA: dihydropteroate synthase [Nitrososphaeraceae archaeon]|jgi:5-methyltetrahydrofolate--homocysteine methyltransferase|nr:dihydropteroate synthase [Nitrososphaeraceae archaeon]
MSLKRMTVPRISSSLKAVDLRQNPPPLIIGERLNTQGSRRAKEMVLNDDIDGLLSLARSQVEDGAHCLDVCVATTERSDESQIMTRLVKRLSLEIDAPLVIDSTDPTVIEAAIKQIPGKPIINSINLEGDGSRFHKLCPLMQKYGLPAVAMCIGPKGMAKTPEEKLETALLLFETGRKYSLQPWQYLFDVLTFTLATGEQEYADSAKNTLKGIELVKKNLSGCFTVLGLSNVSFGLDGRARRALNSVFLHHALKAGLDAVIINAKDVIPYSEIVSTEKKLAENLVFNVHPNALSELISYFQENKGSDRGRTSVAAKLELDKSWSASKKCHFRIVNRIKEGIEDDVVTAISESIPPNNEKKIVPKGDNGTKGSKLVLKAPKTVAHDAAVQTLNEVLLPAMKEVGDKFGAGELILPFVLKSAECMKAAVVELEKYLIRQEGVSKGKLVLCTVYGDVHDIGKNLVKTIFANNGYSVYDLGKQVPLQSIVDKIKEVNADAVGLSALLVSTSKQMQYFVEYARNNNMNISILCGGAAINSNYINRIAKEGGTYQGGVFYCKSAFDGLKTMNILMSDKKESFVSQWVKKLETWQERKTSLEEVKVIARSNIVPVTPPVPPHINQKIRIEADQINLDDVWKFLNKKSLFVLSWGLRGAAADGLSELSHKLLQEWKSRVKKESLFEPKVVYGYFKCHNRNDKLAVELPENQGEVVFDFPRSSKEKHLCLTDYFGDTDLVAFQCVTVGNRVTEIIDQWNKENLYTDAYYLHGLAVETAEALADWTNMRIRQELKISENRGLRYSWGYPSCPDISQHHLLWKILEPSKSGMDLTEAGQIIPDQSTAAIVVHHPEAEYFVL